MNISGGLRHRVDIQVHEDHQDSNTGENIVGWVTVFPKVPAKIEPLSVREFLQSKTNQSEVAARITIRWRAGLSADMRILHGTTVYNPAGVLPDAKSGREYVTIPCSQGVNEG